ncbi:nitroreductase [Marivita sp. GX14005]|uniref:nitroreductase n=1 Tax=Marivita sp. GX14005 TaxID=2942276 RepID=UPI00201978AF|nr:nitroreductase [Marivita sp. GX14005]MCL3883034.1 nitroreductase [Marivita sp. GX14005]
MLQDLSRPDPVQINCASTLEMPACIPEVVDGVMRSRKSTRAFLPHPVSAGAVRDILEIAARAPSGTNIQPWKAYWVDRAGVDKVYGAIAQSGIKPERARWTEYQYYPENFVDPFLSRRRALGKALYNLLGISKRDIPAMRAQFMRNYRFFDAPVGIFVTIDRDLAVGSRLDLGMFIQNVLLAAQARGIASCPIAAFAPFHTQVRSVVGIPDQEILVCGIALGYADPTKPENALQTPRARLEEWITPPPATD